MNKWSRFSGRGLSLAVSHAVMLIALALSACGGDASDTPIAGGTVSVVRGIQPAGAVVSASYCDAVSTGFTAVDGQCLATDSGPLYVAAQTAAKKVKPLQASGPVIMPDMLFDWAERALAEYFPDHVSTVVRDDFQFRHYPKSNSFIAVKSDGGVYVLFLNNDPQVKYVAPLAAFTCMVMPSASQCGPSLEMNSVFALTVGSSIVVTSDQELRDLGDITVRSSLDGLVPAVVSLSLDKRSITITPTVLIQVGAVLTVTVNVTSQSGAQASATGTITTQPVQVISACQEITEGGSYVLSGDVASHSASACFAIHDTRKVELDCAQHEITSGFPLSISNVQNFLVKNCKMSSPDVLVIHVFDSEVGALTGNTITGTSGAFPAVVGVYRSHHFAFQNNSLTGTYQQYYSDTNTISNNRITALPGQNGVPGLVLTMFGSHNTITGNILDGKWDGVRPWGSNQNGADDGVIAQDQTDLLIENNAIRNVFDCGVETLGSVTQSTIRGNYIENAGLCGIGGWYWSSLAGVTIAHNTVVRSGALLYFLRAYGLRAAGSDDGHQLSADTEVLFKDNVFDGNSLLDPVSNWNFGVPPSSDIQLFDNLQYGGAVSSLPGERPAPLTTFQLTNNIFRNNQFGRSFEAPNFGFNSPVPGRIIDGGGNTCKTPTNPGYPLNCH